MKIQIASDIHGEFHEQIGDNTYHHKKDIDIEIFAGDTHHSGRQASQWIEKNKKKSSKAIAIMGNHEYYGPRSRLEREIIKAREETLNGYNGIHWLSSSEIQIKDVAFYGTTLWTDYSLQGDPAINKVVAQTTMNDFKKIKTYQGHKVKPNYFANKHLQELRGIKKWLQKRTNDGTKKIIITHHAPIPIKTPIRVDEPLKSAYFNDLRKKILQWKDEGIELPKYWIFGHSHDKFKGEFEGITFIQNPHGYPSDKKYKPYIITI